jgi:hypothetical protein
MFGLFGKSKDPVCPVPEEARKWLEASFRWLIAEFGAEQIRQRKVLLPEKTSFPFNIDHTENDAWNILELVAKQMNIPPEAIDLTFYDQGLVTYSGGLGTRIFSQQDAGEQYSAGLYAGKNGRNRFNIALETSHLADTEAIIATIAHELSHVKLLGERRITENDEPLTDLVPIIFGLGIFNANTSFRFYKDQDSWGYRKQGYLTQQEWGYALALFACLKEDFKPGWLKYLTPNIRSDFRKAMAYLQRRPPDLLRSGLRKA